MSVTVYGASDDLIEVEGAINEEFTLGNDETGDLLAFSNGVVLRVAYTSDGVWRVTPLAGGSRVTVEFAEGPDSDNYSDRATLTEDPAWVVHGVAWAKGDGE